MTTGDPKPNNTARAPNFESPVRWAAPVVLLLLAFWFVLSAQPFASPAALKSGVDPIFFPPGPARQSTGGVPAVPVADTTARCNDCHQIFQSPPAPPDALTYHDQLVFDHGLNNSCYNCHNRADHETFVAHDGATIAYAEVELLCAKCHGPTYRDWQMGIHGKTMGSWRPSDPRFTRLTCVECHDPHKPAFLPIAPLAGPDTLRMTLDSHHQSVEAEETRNPLQRWLVPRLEKTEGGS